MSTRHAATLLTAVLATAGCSGPSTFEEVCGAYDELAAQTREGNGIFGNPLFNDAEDLGDVAERYEDSPAVQEDGRRLLEIADSDSTSILELQEASANVAAECGRPPLFLSGMTGN